ncbi:MAG: hypothetical protein MJ147_03100 [Clostridia bacterium]|nr:hypothetical protein [Clostridia bacterium]
MIDLHCHILHGIDDGSLSLSESLIMAQSALSGGTRKIVATPHYFNSYQNPEPVSKAQVKRTFNELKSFLKQNRCPVELYLGAEQYGVSDISDIIENDDLITINDSRYLLIEFSLDDDVERAKYVISQLEEYDIVPVLAHPERYEFIQEEPSKAFWFLKHGCLLQVNKGSITGRFGSEPEGISHWLLREHMAHVVASDSHGPYQRTANMSEAFQYTCYSCGERYAYDVFEGNPQRILNDEPID